MVPAPSTIRTQRLELRRPRAADAAAIFATYAGDPDVTRYLSWRCHDSVATTQAFLDRVAGEWDERGVGTYLVEHEGELLGSTGLHMIAAATASTGYCFARRAWGQGYATESCRAMIDLARAMGVTRLEAGCHPDNAASLRVLEKAGFAYERTLPDYMVLPNLGPGLTDILLYAIPL